MLKWMFCFLFLIVWPTSSALALDSRATLAMVVKTCELSYRLSGSAFPCLKLSQAADPLMGYAVLREPAGRERTVFTPLADISGIEDPRLLAQNAPNYFAMAWKERSLLALPDQDRWDGIALAANAAVYRTQDHLHIHMGCLQPGIATLLSSAELSIGSFRRLKVRLERDEYWARFVPSDDSLTVNPAKLVAEGVPQALSHMQGITIALIGSHFGGKKGFIILASPMSSRSGRFVAAESLIDPECRG